MKSCPGCHFLVDDHAEACQYCGATVGDGAVAPEAQPDLPLSTSRESVSTRLVAGAIVAATLAVVGVGTWAFHRTPPLSAAPRTPAVPARAHAVTTRRVQMTFGATTFHVDLPVGASAPAASADGATYRSGYAPAREMDVLHLPGAATGGPADLSGMLSTFAAGWPTTGVHAVTTKAGPAQAFQITNDTELTRGVLIDAGADGVVLIALKAPVGSTLTGRDTAALQRAVDTFGAGA